MNIHQKIAYGIGLNILSPCDGISGGQIACRRSGIPINNYFSSELDEYTQSITACNYPDTKFLGDIKNVKGKDLPKIDMIIGGTPCQSFSFAKGSKIPSFDDPRGKLFFEFVRLVKECEPEVILLENVKMTQKNMDVISNALGIQPQLINSYLVSAQNRKRLYWFGIRQEDGTYRTILIEQPKDKNINIVHILETTEPVKNDGYFRGGKLTEYFDEGKRKLTFESSSLCKQVAVADVNGHDILKRVYDINYKSPCVTTGAGGNTEPFILCGASRGRYNPDGSTSQNLELRFDGKTNALTTVQKDNYIVNPNELRWRSLTVLEMERLQTLDDNYTAYGVFRNAKDYDPTLHEHLQRKKISKTQRMKAIGNGFTISVIEHLLGYIVAESKQLQNLTFKEVA
jgi:DNA-cytosine methyltransferase